VQLAELDGQYARSNANKSFYYNFKWESVRRIHNLKLYTATAIVVPFILIDLAMLNDSACELCTAYYVDGNVLSNKSA
jgi:hypothetical protein